LDKTLSGEGSSDGHRLCDGREPGASQTNNHLKRVSCSALKPTAHTIDKSMWPGESKGKYKALFWPSGCLSFG
jgi:hypothetical protein